MHVLFSTDSSIYTRHSHFIVFGLSVVNFMWFKKVAGDLR